MCACDQPVRCLDIVPRQVKRPEFQTRPVFGDLPLCLRVSLPGSLDWWKKTGKISPLTPATSAFSLNFLPRPSLSPCLCFQIASPPLSNCKFAPRRLKNKEMARWSGLAAIRLKKVCQNARGNLLSIIDCQRRRLWPIVRVQFISSCVCIVQSLTGFFQFLAHANPSSSDYGCDRLSLSLFVVLYKLIRILWPTYTY